MRQAAISTTWVTSATPMPPAATSAPPISITRLRPNGVDIGPANRAPVREARRSCSLVAIGAVADLPLHYNLLNSVLEPQ